MKKVDCVEKFAELGIYYDRPFKTYSNGMRSRVTFGLSMAFDFDVYVIDEVKNELKANLDIDQQGRVKATARANAVKGYVG